MKNSIMLGANETVGDDEIAIDGPTGRLTLCWACGEVMIRGNTIMSRAQWLDLIARLQQMLRDAIAGRAEVTDIEGAECTSN